MKIEKDQLMETRFQMKKEAEMQKHEITQAFEKMKLSGHIDNKVLAKFGVSLGDNTPRDSSLKTFSR